MNDDPQLDRWLSTHRGAIRTGEPENHFDIDTLARHATSQLSRAKSKAVVEHLLVCDDGRCPAFVREQIESASAAADLLYPASDEDSGRARTFQCRDILWDTFQQMSLELDTPLDDLLETAMKQYAKHRAASEIPTGRRPPISRAEMDRAMAPAAPRPAPMAAAPVHEAYAVEAPMDDLRTDEGPVLRSSAPDDDSYALTQSRRAAPPPMQSARPSAMRSEPRGVRTEPAPPPYRSPPAAAGMAAPPMRPPTAPPGGPLRSMVLGRGNVERGVRGGSPAERGPRSAPPPLPSEPARAPSKALGAQLAIEYQGQRVDVTRDRWIIGRSKSQADLRVDDSNVSRQHAAIERVNGVWYIVDLGSTNGVWVGGERVSRRALVDGDVLEITTHHLRIRLT